jgi:hypothetical protein
MTQNTERKNAGSYIEAGLTHCGEKRVLLLDSGSDRRDQFSSSCDIDHSIDTRQRHLPAHTRHLAIRTRGRVVRRHHVTRLHNSTQTSRIIDVVELRMCSPERLRLRRRTLNVLIRALCDNGQCALRQDIRTLVHRHVLVRHAVPFCFWERVDRLPTRTILQSFVRVHADVVAAA